MLEHTLYHIYFFNVFKCVLWFKMLSILVHVKHELEKNVFCCCWVKCSINVKQIHLVLEVIQFNYIFTHFLPTGPVNDCQWAVEISNCKSEFVFSLTVTLVFAPHFDMLLYAYRLKIVFSSWKIGSFIIMQCTSLSHNEFRICQKACILKSKFPNITYVCVKQSLKYFKCLENRLIEPYAYLYRLILETINLV